MSHQDDTAPAPSFVIPDLRLRWSQSGILLQIKDVKSAIETRHENTRSAFSVTNNAITKVKADLQTTEALRLASIRRLEMLKLRHSTRLNDVLGNEDVFHVNVPQMYMDEDIIQLIHNEYTAMTANFHCDIEEHHKSDEDVEAAEIRRLEKSQKELQDKIEKLTQRGLDAQNIDKAFWDTIMEVVRLGPEGVALLKEKMESDGSPLEQTFSEIKMRLTEKGDAECD
jgi:hypothetical protein